MVSGEPAIHSVTGSSTVSHSVIQSSITHSLSYLFLDALIHLSIPLPPCFSDGQRDRRPSRTSGVVLRPRQGRHNHDTLVSTSSGRPWGPRSSGLGTKPPPSVPLCQEPRRDRQHWVAAGDRVALTSGLFLASACPGEARGGGWGFTREIYTGIFGPEREARHRHLTPPATRCPWDRQGQEQKRHWPSRRGLWWPRRCEDRDASSAPLHGW